MNIANYLSYNKQTASVRDNFESNAMFTLFWYSFTLTQKTMSMYYLSTVSSLLPCSSKSFLNFRLSSTRLLINWFLIKNVYMHSLVSGYFNLNPILNTLTIDHSYTKNYYTRNIRKM